MMMVAVAVFMSGCSVSQKASSQGKEQATTEAQQTLHLKVTPPPKLNDSQERRNLSKRLTRFNTDNKVSYIYLISYGNIMSFHTVKGKVSSVNSLLTTPDQIKKLRHAGATYSTVVVASPDLDGSYGENGSAIFFFTTDDTYVEWNDKYMLCDKPLKLSTPPVMVINTTE